MAWNLPHTYPTPERSALPPVFRQLLERGCLSEGEVQQTCDGFFAAARSIADMLIGRGIHTFPNDAGQLRQCRFFYDDWYLYAVGQGQEFVYSLFKMREQEFNAARHEIADGDTPGVTVSFIALQPQVLIRCLDDPTEANRAAWNRELNRVVSQRGQRHHPALKAYFLPVQAQGAYLIAQWYVHFLAGLAVEGRLAVPLAYAALYRRAPHSRLPRFLNANNRLAGETVCDHETIFLKNPAAPDPWESMALLATHTADVSYPSFAAEVQYHARFLTWYARLPIPFLGRSVYDSAIRADMTIDDSDLEGPAPFHNLHSKWVLRQQRCHESAQTST